MTTYGMIRDVPLGTKHRNWKDGNNEDLCRFHRRLVARLGRRGACDDRRRACDERSLAGGGPARIRAERRTRGRMAFARRFRSSPPAGEHRVVFLHVARRIASEPGRRTRLRRCARTGRRAGRDSRPARRRSSRTPLQSPGSAARFRPIHGGSASGPRRLPSARRTVQEDLRLRESRTGPRGGRKNSSDRLHASQDTSSRAHPAIRTVMVPSSRAPPDFGASRVPVGAFENQCGATPTRLSKVRGRRSRASGRKRSNRTSAGRKNADPGQAGVRIEGASCRLGKHADLIPEHVRARMRQLRRREPVQTVGMPPVDSRRQRRARHRMPLRKHASARLPRLEGLPRRSRLTQKNGPHPFCATARTHSGNQS